MRVEVGASREELARRAADAVCQVVREKPDAALGLPSGETPLPLYEEFARRAAAGRADLSATTVFALDELYGVPRDHPATNASYFRQRLSGRVPLRALHVMDSAAEDAEAECERFLRLIAAAGGLDLVVLGIGRNGHIAFNEPGSPFDARCRRVALAPESRETYAPAFGGVDEAPGYGLTLGVADLLDARRALLLASGADKAQVVAQALAGPMADSVPASALQRHPDLTVLLDGEAASSLRAGREGA